MPRDLIPAEKFWYASMVEPLDAVEPGDVEPGEEWSVRRRLKRRGIEHHLAIEEVRTRRHGRWGNPRLVSFLPGYVFVRLGEPRVAAGQIAGIPGVISLLRYASPLPYVMPDRLIAALRARGDEDGVIRLWKAAPARLSVGARVLATGGPWVGHVGRLTRALRHDRWKILMGQLEVEESGDALERVGAVA